jgi:hypothetical protein
MLEKAEEGVGGNDMANVKWEWQCVVLNGCMKILSWPSSGVTYKDMDSDWKLGLFASPMTTTNDSKSPTVITA